MRTRFILSIAAIGLASLSQAVIVLNQIPLNEADTFTIFNSQDYEATNNANDINFIDDFTVNANQLLLTQVEARMAGFGGFTSGSQWSNVTAFRVEVYTSVAAGAGNLTGNAGSQTISAGSATITNPGWSVFNGTTRHISLNVNILLPGAGTYWLGVMGVMPATTNNNQVGVIDNIVTSGGDNAHFINPGGGFGLPGNNQDMDTDAAYRIHAIPEPASMAALGLGVAALVARRRRKAA